MSRVSDNKHHFSDVLGGAILGAIGALFTVSITLFSITVRADMAYLFSKILSLLL